MKIKLNDTLEIVKPFKMSFKEKGGFQATWAMIALILLIMLISYLVMIFGDKSVGLPMADRIFIPTQVMSWVFVAIGLFWFFERCLWIGATKSITLDEAIGIEWFFQQLALTKEKWVDFIRKNDLNVFIAEKSLPTYTATTVKATHFFFLHYFLFDYNKHRFWSSVALQKVCLRQEQVAIFLPEPDYQTPEANQAETVENLKTKVSDVSDLLALNKSLQDQLLASENKNKELKTSYETIQSDLKGYQMRDGKEEKKQTRLMLYTLGLAPIFHKLVEKKPDRQDVTSSAVEELFKTVINDSPTLKTLLTSFGENPEILPPYVFNGFWEILKSLDITNTGGPSPTHNLKRLKKKIFESG